MAEGVPSRLIPGLRVKSNPLALEVEGSRCVPEKVRR